MFFVHFNAMALWPFQWAIRSMLMESRYRPRGFSSDLRFSSLTLNWRNPHPYDYHSELPYERARSDHHREHRRAVFSSACAPTAQFSSRIVSKPTRDIKTIDLVYVENELRAPGLAVSDSRDAKLTSYGYFEMGRLLQERAPLVLAANGLSGTVKVLPQPKPGEAPEIDTSNRDAALLLLNVSGGSDNVLVNLALHRSYLNMQGTLLDARVGTSKPTTLWSSVVSFRLGSDQALGVALTHRVDAKFVDTMIGGLLNSLAADGIITLPQPKAVMPKQTT